MPNGRSSLDVAWRATAVLAALVAGAALAWVIAHWTWALVAPAPARIAPAAPDDPAAAIVAAQLFGTAGRDTAATPVDTIGDVRLLGVIVQRDGGGYAVFRLPSGPKVVAPGQDVAPGLRLGSIGNDGVTLRDGGADRTLALRGASSRAGAPPPASGNTTSAAPKARAPGARGPNVAAADTPKCQPPAGFRGEIVRLNVELVGGLIGQPEAWRAMVEPVNGALVVRQTAGFGQLIGLQQGDRVEQANGIALTVPDDVVGAVLRPLSANQPVRLTGKRNGQTRELWIANVGCGTT
jgi:hypothetical protein